MKHCCSYHSIYYTILRNSTKYETIQFRKAKQQKKETMCIKPDYAQYLTEIFMDNIEQKIYVK